MANNKILVAEDDKFLANAYRIKLLKAGFTVEVVSDGNELLSKLDSFSPDLILLDLIMPVKDGFASLIELKKGEYKNIPVIIASNLGQSEDVKKGLSMGAIDYIVKSDTSLEELIKKINKHAKK